jgi:hypothetical protein
VGHLRFDSSSTLERTDNLDADAERSRSGAHGRQPLSEPVTTILRKRAVAKMSLLEQAREQPEVTCARPLDS